jgi:ribosomal protein L11 methyltransferase
MNYLEFSFKIDPLYPWSEILTVYLLELDFEGFYEENGQFKACIQEPSFNPASFKELMISLESKEVNISYKKVKIPHQNWNVSWESNFQPVEIDDELIIVAPFHDIIKEHSMRIVIQPKMSFGTGHHQTTHLMCTSILKLDLKDKKVLDMGSGTGVLSILSEKMGSKDITAVDIEEWSAENCNENASANSCIHINSICGDVDVIIGRKFDYIFANINKNILMKQMSQYFKSLSENGFLYLSGFFDSDSDELIALAEKCGMSFISSELKEGWALLVLKK